MLLDSIVEASQVLRVINCSVVALAHTAGTKNADRLRVTYITEDSRCYPHTLGFGIVRSIDVRHKVLHIITPLDVSILSHANTIIYGKGMSVPPFFTSKASDFLPDIYSTQNNVSGYASMGMKSRGNILRRGHSKRKEF